jgi:hypothetical protein
VYKDLDQAKKKVFYRAPFSIEKQFTENGIDIQDITRQCLRESGSRWTPAMGRHITKIDKTLVEFPRQALQDRLRAAEQFNALELSFELPEVGGVLGREFRLRISIIFSEGHAVVTACTIEGS